MKTRRTTIGLYFCEVQPGWADSKLVFKDQTDGSSKEVVIKIDRPSDISYIREQLDKLEAYWREQLAAIKVTG